MINTIKTNNMAQQTAVEWLQIQLKNGVDFNPLDPLSYPKAVDNLFEQAKQMEKEQLDKVYYQGQESKYTGGPSYNELYNK